MSISSVACSAKLSSSLEFVVGGLEGDFEIEKGERDRISKLPLLFFAATSSPSLTPTPPTLPQPTSPALENSDWK
jgi:hypothetical protein